MSKWSRANNRYYVRGYGYVGCVTCCRCESVVRGDRIVITEISGYNLCTRCHRKITSYKSIRKLFEPVEVLGG